VWQVIGSPGLRQRLLVATLSLAVLVGAVVALASRPDGEPPARLALTTSSPAPSASAEPSASPDSTSLPDDVAETPHPTATPTPLPIVSVPPSPVPTLPPVPVPTARPTDPPRFFVSVDGEPDADNHLVTLRRTKDGSVLRVLAGNVGERFVAKGVTASADGMSVYFARWDPDRCAGPGETGNQAWDVVRVPVTGGPAKVIDEGTWPELSPDGQYLAYATPPQVCGQHNLLVVLDVETGTKRTLRFKTTGLYERLSWSPDSTRVLGYHEGEPGTGHFVVDVTGEELYAKHVDLEGVSGAVLVDRDVVAAHAGDDEGTWIVLADRDSGRVIRRLFPAGNQTRALASDASGQFILVSDNGEARLAWGSAKDGRVPLGDYPSWDLAWLPD
jgi:hypothetical protein